MMKHSLITLLLLCALGAQGQEVLKYWVQFADKAGSPYSLDRPDEYLSPRALQRRQAFRITVDSLDLPVSPQYLQQLQQAGFTVHALSRWMNGAVLFAPDQQTAARLDTLPFVIGHTLYETASATAPYWPIYDFGDEILQQPFDTPYSPAYYGSGFTQIDQLHGIALHRHGFQGQGLLIGVCDGGFPDVDNSPLFDSLRHSGRIVATRDFVWGGQEVYSIHTHGTMVLSTLASDLPGCYVGTAPKASYILCRTEDTFAETPLEEYYWIAAAEYLDSMGADIISTSLGYYEFDDSTFNYHLSQLDGQTAPMTRAADIAVSRGMLLVCSAGNEGQAPEPHLGVPADAARVLTVGAVDSESHYALFSSPGPTADLRIKPDVTALGEQITVGTTDAQLRVANGTSFSCPVMAGMMACLWQRYPLLTPEQLCDSVRAWGNNADFPNFQTGYGIPDFSRAVPSDATSIPTTEEGGMCHLYPNPATDRTTLLLSHGGMAHITLFDPLGRPCRTLHTTAAQVDIPLGDLPRGCYTLRITRGTATETLPLLLQ